GAWKNSVPPYAAGSWARGKTSESRGLEQPFGQVVEQHAREHRERDRRASLPVHLRHQVGGGDVECHAGRDTERGSDERLHAEDREPAEDARRADGRGGEERLAPAAARREHHRGDGE